VRKSLLLRCISIPLAILSGFYASFSDANQLGERPVYIINSGDQLLITVLGHEKELTALVSVRPDGMITYPMIGDIKAAGLTISQLSSDINEKISELNYYEDPQVTIQLKQTSREIIYVFGNVREPGQKMFPEPASVVEVIAAAGGYEETADLAKAKLIKDRGSSVPEVISVDLEKLIQSDIIDQGMVDEKFFSEEYRLKSGDVLIIPSAVKEERINIIGHVRQPGQYPVKSPISVMEALAIAGGALEDTADVKRVRVIKSDGNMIILSVTDYQRVIEPGDSVFVLEKGKINVIGSVKTQGQFAIDGEVSVIEALAMAGVEEYSNLKKLKIIRSSNEIEIVDVSDIWKEEYQDTDYKLYDGDTLVVPRTFRINWGAISTGALIFSTLYAIFK
jgi:polysaccharide export outer membrane protein